MILSKGDARLIPFKEIAPSTNSDRVNVGGGFLGVRATFPYLRLPNVGRMPAFPGKDFIAPTRAIYDKNNPPNHNSTCQYILTF